MHNFGIVCHEEISRQSFHDAVMTFPTDRASHFGQRFSRKNSLTWRGFNFAATGQNLETAGRVHSIGFTFRAILTNPLLPATAGSSETRRYFRQFKASGGSREKEIVFAGHVISGYSPFTSRHHFFPESLGKTPTRPPAGKGGDCESKQ